MKKLWVLFFCFTTIISAQNFYEESETNSTITDTPKAQSIFLSYEKVPSTLYVGELFPIKVKAIIANDDFEEITSSFEDSQDVTIINPDAKWQWFSNNIFYNTFYIKAQNSTAKLPSLDVNIYKNSQKIDSGRLEATTPNIIKLNNTKQFSGVIAKSLKIKKYKTTIFDDKSFIVVLEMEALEANLKDFSLKWVIRDGIDSSSDNLPYFQIYYYAIIPSFTKNFVFTYFNRDSNKFEKLSIPIVVIDDKISTQIDLNPAQSSLQIYKDGAYLIIALISLVLAIKRRKAVYVVLFVLIVGLATYDKNPLNSIKVDKGSKIKILPTEKSTIFKTIDKTIYAKKLDEKDDYIKILLPNGKIGWMNVSKD